MKTTIRTLTLTAAAFGMFAAASVAFIGQGTAHADDGVNPIYGLPDKTPNIKPAITIVPLLPTATPTPKVHLNPDIQVKPQLTVVPQSPTATPTPKIKIVIPTKTPTPKPEIAIPPTVTPTPELPLAVDPTATPTDEPVEEATEEPTSTPEPAAEQPSSDNGNNGNTTDPQQPAETDGGDTEVDADTEAESAETSDQYSLEDDRRGRERGSGMENLPGVNLVAPIAKEVIGADELSFVGGALALFGLSLGLVAYRRERRGDQAAE